MSSRANEDFYRGYRALEGATGGDGTARLFVDRYLVPHLAPFRHEAILEIGAGTGVTLRALGQAGFTQVSGVDLSASQVEVAVGNGIPVELADGLTALAARAPGSLGAILALDVLEHLTLDELLRLMELAADRLRPGGVLVVRVPNGEGLFAGALRYGDLTHLRAFTRRSLSHAFALRGLGTVEVRPVRPMAHGIASAVRALLWLLVEGLVRVAAAAESGRFDALVTRNILAIARRVP